MCGGSSSGETHATRAQGRILDYNLDRLKQLDRLRDPYMAGGLQGAMAAYDKYSDPAYIDRMVGQANTDAMQSFGQTMGAVNRNLSRYGAAFNPTRMASEMTSAGLQGAAMRVGAMNTMRNRIDDQQTTAAMNKWRLLNDMQTESMAAGNQIASGYGQLGGVMAQNQNNWGQGMQGLGSLAAAGLDWSQRFRDGGAVDSRNTLLQRGMGDMVPAPAAPARPSGLGNVTTGARIAGALPGLANAAASSMTTGALSAVPGAQAAGMALQNAMVGGLGSALGALGTVVPVLGLGAAIASMYRDGGEVQARADGGSIRPPDEQLMADRARIYAAVFGPDEPYQGAPAQDQRLLAYLKGQVDVVGQLAGQAGHPDVQLSNGELVKMTDGTTAEVVGPGTGTSDSVRGVARPGTFVVPTSARQIPGVDELVASLPGGADNPAVAQVLDGVRQLGLQKRYGGRAAGAQLRNGGRVKPRKRMNEVRT